jgi:hypothetical protein
MANIFIKSFFLITILTFFACGKEKRELAKMDFGEIHPNQNIEKTLTLNFNDEAKKDSIAFVEFAYELEDGSIPEGIEFTVDNKPVKTNTLKFFARDFVSKSNNNVKIGIHFPITSKQQEYAGEFRIIHASEGLQQYITQGNEKLPVKVGESVGKWKAVYNDPIPLWVKLTIALGAILLIGSLLYFILTRDNMPFGHKTFKDGMLSFPEGEANVTSVRLEKLRTYNLSSVFEGIEAGLVLEPYDKIQKGKKRRFARLKNNSSTLDLKLIFDNKEEMMGAAQELYHLDEIKVITPDKKSCLIRYTNSKIIRSL